MQFEKAFKELLKGKRIRRKEWESLMHLRKVGEDIKTYKGEYAHYYNNANVLLTSKWLVIDGDGKELSFLEALEEMKAKKKITNKDWLEKDDDKFMFVDSGQFAVCRSIEFEFMPTYKCLISLDWEIMS